MNFAADISSRHLDIIVKLLKQHLSPGIKVWAFGSRANGMASDASDLDLALESSDKLGLQMMANLRYAFEESLLPYKVDVVDLSAIDESFKNIVEKNRVPILWEELAEF